MDLVIEDRRGRQVRPRPGAARPRPNHPVRRKAARGAGVPVVENGWGLAGTGMPGTAGPQSRPHQPRQGRCGLARAEGATQRFNSLSVQIQRECKPYCDQQRLPVTRPLPAVQIGWPRAG